MTTLLVRGTTCHKIVQMLYKSGAKEVHVRIACPEILYPDFYGVDMPTRSELLANGKTIDEMCDYIQCKSLKFLSLKGLSKLLVKEREIIFTRNLVTLFYWGVSY